MFKLKIVAVGKIKKAYWNEAISHYEKMLRSSLRIDCIHVKDCPNLSGPERKIHESELILQKLTSKDRVIALHETGTLYTSYEFAAMLQKNLENPVTECCFVIGGAHGLSAELLQRAQATLSLSPMTMPHELAHVVLYEQLFRATTIIANRTYHY